MKYLCLILCFFVLPYPCAADKSKDLPKAVDPHDVKGGGYIDPYDVGTDGQRLDRYVDPYDVNEKNPSLRKPNNVPDSNFDDTNKSITDLFAYDDIVEDVDEQWGLWRAENVDSPKPPLDWGQVGMETSAGYVGAFGGSVVGMFGGFLLGSAYDFLSGCKKCWVDIAFSTSTLGGSLGAASGVYMFGNNDKQLGSFAATYAGTVLPVLIGTFAYSGSKQINKSGFYLLTMPLLATVGYNITRHYRKEGEKPLFNNIFVDDMWVSKEKDNALAFNVQLSF